MAFKRYPIKNRNEIGPHLTEIAEMFMTYNENLFSRIEVINDNTLEFYGKDLLPNNIFDIIERKLFKISIISKSNNRNYFQLKIYTSNGNDSYTPPQPVAESTILSADEDTILQSNYYLNFISEYIHISDSAVALTLTNIGTIDRLKASPGVIIFTRTANGKIAVICPSYTYFNTSPPSVAGDTSTKNYLICATIDSMGQLYYDNIECVRISSTNTIFQPLVVYGEPTDYIVDGYFVPVTSSNILSYIDGIITSGDVSYYYNGMVAIKI
jgi:hypothetical protein